MINANPPTIKYEYTDEPHAYYLGGRKAAGASTTAKIVADTFLVEAWGLRQVAIGVALDDTIRENVACHIDNNTRINTEVENAKRVAGAHRKADRGTQAHRSLQMLLLGRRDELLTTQQHADAAALARTLDKYGLEPTPYVERFIYFPGEDYPGGPICGRFDAILRNRRDELVMSDLKTGLNAVRYPHTTCVQLGFYRNAPWMSSAVEVDGNKTRVTAWERTPDCDPDVGYVIQLEPDATVGTLYELDIAHGWEGAALALDVRDWRAYASWGDDLAKLVEPLAAGNGSPSWRDLIVAAQTLTELRLLYATARQGDALTPALKGMFLQRSTELPAES